MKAQRLVREIYRKLAKEWGAQHWWPAESGFEVVVGTILTQNTSWTNVERAITNVRASGALSLERIRSIPIAELEALIRPSGYFRQKAARIKAFVEFVDREYGGSLDAMLARPTSALREELLTLKGIGRETADSILLYAGQHPTFVVDAYTRRVLQRHEVISSQATYDDVRRLVEEALQDEMALADRDAGCLEVRPRAHPPSAMSLASRSTIAQVFNEMHGLFVQLGKHYCNKRNPDCESCPLNTMLKRPIRPDWDMERTSRRPRSRLGTSRAAKSGV